MPFHSELGPLKHIVPSNLESSQLALATVPGVELFGVTLNSRMEEIDRGAENFVNAFYTGMDNRNMRAMIVEYGSMGPDAQTDFFQGENEPDFGPTISMTTDQVIGLLPRIGGYLYHRWQEALQNQNKAQAAANGQRLYSLIHHGSRAATLELTRVLDNEVAGIDAEARRNGVIRSSDSFTQRVEEVSRVVGKDNGDELAALVQGRFQDHGHMSFNLVHADLVNTTVNGEVRRVEEEVVHGLSHNKIVAMRKIQEIGRTFGAMRQMFGLDFESFCKAAGFPLDRYEGGLRDVLKSGKLREEFSRRLEYSAPHLKEEYDRNKPLRYRDLLMNRALHLELSDKPIPHQAAKGAVAAIDRQIQKTLLFSFGIDKHDLGVSVIIPDTSERGGDANFINTSGQSREVITLDSHRIDSTVDQVGHEIGHAVHKAIVDATHAAWIKAKKEKEATGERFDEPEPPTWELTDKQDKETFAQTLGDGSSQVVKHPLLKKVDLARGDDTEEFMRAMRTAGTASSMLYIHREIDRLYSEGVDITNIPDHEAYRMAVGIDEMIDVMYEDVVGLQDVFTHGSANALSPQFWGDGIVYAGLVAGAVSDDITMRNVIEKARLGRGWMKTQEGQILFGYMCYLSTTGMSQVERLEKMKTVDIEEARVALERVGITLRPQEQEAA